MEKYSTQLLSFDLNEVGERKERGIRRKRERERERERERALVSRKLPDRICDI